MKPEELAKKTKAASGILSHAATDQKNSILMILEELIAVKQEYLFNENRKDIENAQKEGIPKSMVDRLRIDNKTIREMQASIRDVIALPDPVGEIVKLWNRPNKLLVGRMRIPIGVILVIYESRPNVTIEAFSLCLKSGNCVILKGGSEAYYSNLALFSLITESVEKAGITADVAQFIGTGDRAYIYELLKLDEYIDLIIPRGGETLIRSVVEQSRIPVLKHYKGVCHIYVDEWAQLDLAYKVCLNAKVQKPATCNAMETLLVHKSVANAFLPEMANILYKQGVAIKGCEETIKILKGIGEANDQDWHEEYLDLTLSIKIVGDIDEAVSHIRKYGSNHTDAIITANYDNAWRFLREVNSSCVLINASTRLNDGYQLGLGAEMGISTTKLHAFGPMGLEELTVNKFIAFGDGQLRE